MGGSSSSVLSPRLAIVDLKYHNLDFGLEAIKSVPFEIVSTNPCLTGGSI